MLSFFRKKPLEIQDLLASMNRVIENLPEDLLPLGTQLLQKLSNEVKHQWKAKDEQNYADLIKNGETHDAFIYNFLVHSTGDQLESGQHHTYRGMLSIRGKQYKRLFEHSINTMVESGEYTQDWANVNLRNPVNEGIKSAG